MGYTTTNTELLIGLGSSAISDGKYAYSQNLKKVEDYAQAIADDSLAVFKGHIHTDEDLKIKACIRDVTCNGKIQMENVYALNDPVLMHNLRYMQQEGVLLPTLEGYHVSDTGRAFIRNICSLFDQKMKSDSQDTTRRFSQSI
jgi:oxygen-independent coproporphyrinogen-3 oxidase